MTAQHEPL